MPVSRSVLRRTEWRQRPALSLANDRVELTVLPGGGHIAAFRQAGGPNLLWESPWQGIDPQRYTAAAHARRFGQPPAGPFLAGFTGHVVCADYFGGPSAGEASQGLPLHGEVASREWKATGAHGTRPDTRLCMKVRAPLAEFTFEREIILPPRESVACVREGLINERATGRFFHWVEHATFGPPLLAPDESVVTIPAHRARTWPYGYEGKALLRDDREFRWPRAPLRNGGSIDLTRPFARSGKGFVVATLFESGRQHAFVAVLNWRLGLIAGYSFRREDFPWLAVWEENRARTSAPWSGVTQARGMEFGNTPLPVGLPESVFRGPLFDVPGIGWLGAKARCHAGYAMFVASSPAGWRQVRDVELKKDAIVVRGDHRGQRVSLPATALVDSGVV